MGCPLRCAWCDVPESWDSAPRMGHNEPMCQHCFRCAMGCPNRALTKSSGMVVRNQSACTACGRCYGSCPGGAMERFGLRMSVEEVVRRILAERRVHEQSGYEVVFTGGEPMAQWRFVQGLLMVLQDEGMRNRVETCGHFDSALLDGLLQHADLIIFDIKTINAPKHKALTGVGNDLILANLRRLLANPGKSEVIPRIPLVPGLCAGKEELLQVLAWLIDAGYGGEVRLVGFEVPCREHWRRVGRQADFRALPELPAEHVERAAELVESAGLRPVVGR